MCVCAYNQSWQNCIVCQRRHSLHNTKGRISTYTHTCTHINAHMHFFMSSICFVVDFTFCGFLPLHLAALLPMHFVRLQQLPLAKVYLNSNSPVAACSSREGKKKARCFQITYPSAAVQCITTQFGRIILGRSTPLYSIPLSLSLTAGLSVAKAISSIHVQCPCKLLFMVHSECERPLIQIFTYAECVWLYECAL